MGIKSNFTQTLSKITNNTTGDYVHVSDFAFKRIAIDTMLYMYKYKSVMGDAWLMGFINMIKLLKKNNIHLIFVLDGKAPEQKKQEQNSRIESKEKTKRKIAQLEEDVKAYKESGFISDKLLLFVSESDKTVNLHDVYNEIKKKKKQVSSININDINVFTELLDTMNIQHITASCEGEKLCCKLCKDKIVDAVLSDDSDVIAYGSPISLQKLDNKTGICFKVEIDSLLNKLSLNYSEFLDFCIMCGTDYNKNIPGIGSMTSYNLITKHRRIENIKLDNKDILNVNIVRKLFTDFSDCNCKNIIINYLDKPLYKNICDFLHSKSLYGITIKDFTLMFDSFIVFIDN